MISYKSQKNIYYKKKPNKGKWIIIIVYSLTIADTLLTKKRIKKNYNNTWFPTYTFTQHLFNII